MSYRSKAECDSCHKEEDAPQDGGFPFGWAEINIKPSLRGKEEAHKRRRLHLCSECMDKLLPQLNK